MRTEFIDKEYLAKLQKIAKLIVVGVAQIDIAEIVGLSEGRISQIKETEEFREVYSHFVAERIEEEEQLNGGWDTVEALALATMAKHLTWSKDPDYALRAAMIANKANRRGGMHSRAIDTQASSRATISLTQNFIQRIEQVTIAARVAVSDVPKKEEDMLNQKQLETFLEATPA